LPLPFAFKNKKYLQAKEEEEEEEL